MSKDELRERILKEGKVSMSVWRVSKKIYEDGTSSKSEATTQEIVEIPIDDLMKLIDQHTNEKLARVLVGRKTTDRRLLDNDSKWVATNKGYNQAIDDIKQNMKEDV